jgi:hypothetical protein
MREQRRSVPKTLRTGVAPRNAKVPAFVIGQVTRMTIATSAVLTSVVEDPDIHYAYTDIS